MVGKHPFKWPFFDFISLKLLFFGYKPILDPFSSNSESKSILSVKNCIYWWVQINFSSFSTFRTISHYSPLFRTILHYSALFRVGKNWFFDFLTSRKYGVNDPSGISHFCLSSKWYVFGIFNQFLAKNCFRQIKFLFWLIREKKSYMRHGVNLEKA